MEDSTEASAGPKTAAGFADTAATVAAAAVADNTDNIDIADTADTLGVVATVAVAAAVRAEFDNMSVVETWALTMAGVELQEL